MKRFITILLAITLSLSLFMSTAYAASPTTTYTNAKLILDLSTRAFYQSPIF